MSAQCASPDNLRCKLAPLSLPKANRVTRSAEFRSTYQTGIRITSRFFVAFCKRTDDTCLATRFGFTCPRALGKAVTRNRIKRRMRESVRAQESGLTQGWVVVFNPRRTVLEADFVELCREINRVLAKCRNSSSVS